MPDAAPLIDLDSPPPPAAQGRVRPLSRTAVALAVAAVAILALGGAAPARRQPVRVVSVGGAAAAAFRLTPDALYTAGFAPGASGGAATPVRRYDLRTGAEVWAGTVPHVVQGLATDPVGGLLIARSRSSPRVTFLDAADGSVLWHVERPGTSLVTAGNGRALLRDELSASRAELRLVEIRTAGVVWNRVVDTRGDLRIGDDGAAGEPARILVIGEDGRVTTLRYADGAVLGTGSVGVPMTYLADPATAPDYAGVFEAGDRIYLARRVGGDSSLAAYRLPDVTLQWRAEAAPAGYVSDCGPVVCVTGDGELSALDPADGSVRWSSRKWAGGYRGDDGTLLVFDNENDRTAVELDPLTGAELRTLGETMRVGGLDLHADAVAPGRTWMIAGAVPLGQVETTAPYACQVARPYVACPTISGRTDVWLLPPS